MKATLGLVGPIGDEARFVLSFEFALRPLSLSELPENDCDALLIAHDGDAAETVSALRSASESPIVVIVPSDDAGLRIRVLESGADDVVGPGCSAPEILARVRAVRRRGVTLACANLLRAATIVIDRDSCEVRREGRLVELRHSEYRVLLALAEEHPKFVTRDELRRRIWGTKAYPGIGALYVAVSSLRTSLDRGFGTPALRTKRGLGYALTTE